MSRYMQHALRLAARGLGNVWPNPAVGCVLTQEERVVGTGYTQPGGRPHAEVMALREAGDAAKGSTAYVTLEPCAHYGKTPPCAEALIAAGLKKVVAACSDPDPRVNGQGIAMLRRAGITVETGQLEAEALALNAGFFSRLQQGRPLVAAKMAVSLDGRTALANGVSQWITSPEDRARGHLLRAQYDAIVVGTETVLMDNPRLNCRLPGLAGRSPLRLVLDRQRRIPDTAAIFDVTHQPTWLISSDATRPPPPGVELCVVPETTSQRLDLPAMLQVFGERGLTRVLIEGGGTLMTALYKEGLIDHWHWFRGPCLLGGDARPALGALGYTALPAALAFSSACP